MLLKSSILKASLLLGRSQSVPKEAQDLVLLLGKTSKNNNKDAFKIYDFKSMQAVKIEDFNSMLTDTS